MTSDIIEFTKEAWHSYLYGDGYETLDPNSLYKGEKRLLKLLGSMPERDLVMDFNRAVTLLEENGYNQNLAYLEHYLEKTLAQKYGYVDPATVATWSAIKSQKYFSHHKVGPETKLYILNKLEDIARQRFAELKLAQSTYEAAQQANSNVLMAIQALRKK